DGLKAHSFYEMTMDELNDLLDSVGLSKERAIDQSPSYDKTRKKENRPIVTSKGKSKTRF
ncbi:MAG: hypothetical protein Q7U30_09170, partial [Methylicorpusculum sp.]|nr:hypothetical protein [Methylicorpusculum sp.]